MIRQLLCQTGQLATLPCRTTSVSKLQLIKLVLDWQVQTLALLVPDTCKLHSSPSLGNIPGLPQFGKALLWHRALGGIGFLLQQTCAKLARSTLKTAGEQTNATYISPATHMWKRRSTAVGLQCSSPHLLYTTGQGHCIWGLQVKLTGGQGAHLFLVRTVSMQRGVAAMLTRPNAVLLHCPAM